MQKKILDEIKDKNQLQRFLGSLNYVSGFYPNLRTYIKHLFQRPKKNHLHLTEEHTRIIKQVKTQVKEIPCLDILHLDAFPIIEIDASNIGYGGILKQDFQKKKKNSLFVFIQAYGKTHNKIILLSKKRFYP